MYAELMHGSFEVEKSDTDPRQAIIAGTRSIAWTWRIRAKELGTQSITVNVYGEWTVDGETFRNLATSITLKVNVVEKSIPPKVPGGPLSSILTIIVICGAIGLIIAFLMYRVNLSKKLKDTAEDQQREERQIKLRQTLDEFFTLSELRGLCFDMNIDFENLGGETKSDKVVALIEFCKHRGRTSELEAKVSELRPNASQEDKPE